MLRAKTAFEVGFMGRSGENRHTFRGLEMAYVAVWMDHSHAKLFTFVPGKVERVTMKREDHHHHKTNHTDQEKKTAMHKFFKDLAHALEPAKEIYVIGSGTAKTEFKHYLEEHKMKKVSDKIVGMDGMEEGTDGEIEKKAHAFFKHRNVFEG